MRNNLAAFLCLSMLTGAMASCGDGNNPNDLSGSGDVTDAVQADTLDDLFVPDTHRPDDGTNDPGIPDGIEDTNDLEDTDDPDGIEDTNDLEDTDDPDGIEDTSDLEDTDDPDGMNDTNVPDGIGTDVSTGPCLDLTLDNTPFTDALIDFGTLLRGKRAVRVVKACNRCDTQLTLNFDLGTMGGVCDTFELDSAYDNEGNKLDAPSDYDLLALWLNVQSLQKDECLSFHLAYDSDLAHSIPSHLECAVLAVLSDGHSYNWLMRGRSVESLPSTDAADCVDGGKNCHVNGVCYAAVSGSPDNPCAVCQPAYASGSEFELTDWMDGHPCDDQFTTTVEDICTEGTCAGTESGAPPRVVSLATGAAHSCAVIQGGDIYCWGHNQLEQCGIPGPDTDIIGRAYRLSILPGYAEMVAAGQSHTCATMETGGAYCWGANDKGQLGLGNTDSNPADGSVTGITAHVQKLAAGIGHTCALLDNGDVMCWGTNELNQLGRAGETSSVPLAASLPLPAIDIACGDNHSCAVLNDGRVVCWGDNASGQSAPGGTPTVTTPTLVTDISDAQKVATGSGHTCALLDSGEIVCWGADQSGQRGIGRWSFTPPPSRVLFLNDATSITAAGDHACAMNQSGDVSCWGENTEGCLGDRSILRRRSPVDVLELWQPASAVATGLNFSCAAISSGGVRCWGSNSFGQLGDGRNTGESYIPIEVLWPGID